MSEWISVEDRLPPFDVDVIVTNGSNIEITHRTVFESNKTFLMERFTGNVTYWRPLPILPSEYIIISQEKPNDE